MAAKKMLELFWEYRLYALFVRKTYDEASLLYYYMVDVRWSGYYGQKYRVGKICAQLHSLYEIKFSHVWVKCTFFWSPQMQKNESAAIEKRKRRKSCRIFMKKRKENESSPIQRKIYLFSIQFKLESDAWCSSVRAMFVNVFWCRKASHCILERGNGFVHAATHISHHREGLIYYSICHLTVCIQWHKYKNINAFRTAT